jgi:tryptophanyl-tRNA synthetase
MNQISLTGIKPTGTPHLGNYLGSIRPALEIAKSANTKGFYFIADYHSLTSVHSGEQLRSDIYEVAATWLACGLDPKSVTLYKQSDIAEILELNWILSCFCAKGLMNRAHAYKSKSSVNVNDGRDIDHGINLGLYGYPVLMAADILILNSDIVPVGADQLQHVEIARDLANAFNHHYGEVIKLPKAQERDDKLVVGLDGRKMSKSYNNTIPLFVSEKKLRKLIMKIVTNSLPPEAPKDPNESTIMDLYKMFATKGEVAELSKQFLQGIGWGVAKQELFEVVNRELSPYRERYNYFMENKSEIDQILKQGADEAKKLASKNLAEIKSKIGVL